MLRRRSSGSGRRSRARKGCSQTSASCRTRRRTSSRPSARSWSAIAVSSTLSAVSWIESLSPWPEEFGLDRVRRHAEGATQFEVLTAAAFTEFREQGVDVAVVEAGLGGRLDATNVIEARVVLLTNVALEHTDVLGDTHEAIAREKLAVVKPGAIGVLGEPEWAELLPDNEVRAGGAREAAEAFLGRPLEREAEAALPGRLEWRGPDELWDGAHNPAGLDWLLERLPKRTGS